MKTYMFNGTETVITKDRELARRRTVRELSKMDRRFDRLASIKTDRGDFRVEGNATVHDSAVCLAVKNAARDLRGLDLGQRFQVRLPHSGRMVEIRGRLLCKGAGIPTILHIDRAAPVAA